MAFTDHADLSPLFITSIGEEINKAPQMDPDPRTRAFLKAVNLLRNYIHNYLKYKSK